MCILPCLPSIPSSLILLAVVEVGHNSFALHILLYHIDNKSCLNDFLQLMINAWGSYCYSVYDFQPNLLNQVPLELVHAASAVRPTMEAAFSRCAAHDTASVASREAHHAWTETKQCQHA